jgi:hypothetical protein
MGPCCGPDAQGARAARQALWVSTSQAAGVWQRHSCSRRPRVAGFMLVRLSIAGRKITPFSGGAGRGI